MGVPVPFSTSFALLLLALPFVWLLGRAAASAVSRDRAVRSVLAVGLSVVFSVIGVHVTSLATGSLRSGLPLGLVGLAFAGIAAEIARGRDEAALAAEDGAGPSPWMWVTAAAATVAMMPLALRYHFHDELFLTGHMSIAGQLQNGIYPPRHIAFPDTPLRYHYGFDMVTAATSALLHARLDVAIDVATLALFALSWCLFWVLGERLVGRSRAWLVPVLALFGGGLPVACQGSPYFVTSVLEICGVGKHYVNPPVPSYFLQHPWSLGVPVGVTALLVLTSRRAPREPVRLVAMAATLAALSMSQVTMFVAFVPSFLVAELVGPDGLEPRRGLRALAALGAAGLAARLMGGFFTSAPGLARLSFVPHAGFGETLRDTLSWNLQTFGALLPLGVIGLFAARRERVVFGLLAAGALGVVNGVRFEGSNDIMKFATLATLALGVLSSSALRPWTPRARAVLPRASRWAGAVAIALVGLACVSGATFAAVAAVDPERFPHYLKLVPVQPGPADAEIIAWLRERIRPGDLVYRGAPHGWAYAQWGGLPVPWLQWTVKALGFPEERIRSREALLETRPTDVAAWRAEGFRFLVLDETWVDAGLQRAAEDWIDAGQARQVRESDDLVVIELVRE